MILSGLTIPDNGKRVYKDDWDAHFLSTEAEIVNRNLDLFGFGIASGGVCTVLGGGLVRLSETIAYNKDGQRVFVPMSELTVPEGASVLVVRHAFSEVLSEPDFSQSARSYRVNSFEAAFVGVAGEYDLPICSLQRAGNTVTVIEDLREWQVIQNKNLATGIKIGDLANLRIRLLAAIGYRLTPTT